MPRIGITLHPLDTLFFRSGRPFGGGLPGESGLPSPQVLAGAIRTLFLRKENADFSAMRGKSDLREAFAAAGVPWLAEVKIRGPWLAEETPNELRPLVRRPANLEAGDGAIHCLIPFGNAPVPGWRPPAPGMLPLWRKYVKADKKPAPEFITWDGLRVYLSGGNLGPHHFRRRDELLALEDRVGIGIDPDTYATKEEVIYTTRNLRLRQEVCFYAEILLPDAKTSLLDEPAIVTWGGENRRATVTRVPPVSWPSAPETTRTLLLALAPAFLPERWRPRLPDGDVLRGAAVDGPFSISGWDYARRGPKPTRFGIEAGSVYFIEGSGPRTDSICEAWEDESSGYGLYLKGTWNYAN